MFHAANLRHLLFAAKIKNIIQTSKQIFEKSAKMKKNIPFSLIIQMP